MKAEKQNDNAADFAVRKKSKGGLIRVWNAFLYSCAGFKAAFKHEHACRQEIFLFVPAGIAALFFPVGVYEKAAMVSVLFLVLGMEMANSAIEACVDDISLEYRDLAKRAKDLGSAAVFCTMVIAALVWLSVIYVNFIR